MSSLIDELAPTAVVMRELEQEYFGVDYTDENLQQVYLRPARNQLKLDIYSRFNRRIASAEDESFINSLVRAYTEEFRSTLMYLQLFMFFASFNAQEGSKAFEKKIFYRTRYEEMLDIIRDYKIEDSYSIPKSLRITRG